MPHRPTQHLNSASSEPYPSSIGGGSTPTNHPKPTNFTATLSHHPTPNPDLIQPFKPSFMLKHLTSLTISHKAGAPHKQSQINHPPQPPPPPRPSPPPPPPPPLLITHFQAKAMASSAIPDSSKFCSLPKSNSTRVAPRLEKERGKPAKRVPSKEKPQKCKGEVERRKLEGVIKCKKKGSHDGGVQSRVLFEDVKVENSRVNPLVEEHDVVKRHSVSLAPGGGGRRRSFSGGASQVDLGDVFAVNGVKVVSADMPPFMQIHAVDCARKAFDSMEKFTSKNLAFTLKKEFDGVYGPAWHCIVGTNFGSFVTHSVGGFLYFSMDQKLYILLFKTSVQKAG